MDSYLQFQKLFLICFCTIAVTPLAVYAQSTPPSGVNIPPNTPAKLEETIPQPSPTLPTTTPTETDPILPASTEENLPTTTFPSGETFFIREIKIKGNSVLQDEINRLKQPLENKKTI